MASVDTIEDYFVTQVAALAGIDSALDHEPERLPAKLPVVTLLWRGFVQEDVETGPNTENQWTWRVRLHVALGQREQWRSGQASMKVLVPALLNFVRDNPALGNTCERATLEDVGEEPEFDNDSRMMWKDMVLRAFTSES